MQSELGELIRMDRRRLEKFHAKCRHRCLSKKTFTQGFDIDQRHIADGYLKNPMRAGVSNELIASVIAGGTLLLDKSSADQPLVIAIGAIVKLFEWVESGSGSVIRHTEDAVKVRVVIRENRQGPKDFIVTQYVEMPTSRELKSLGEVEREFWN